jgi:hypothetical protein
VRDGHKPVLGPPEGGKVMTSGKQGAIYLELNDEESDLLDRIFNYYLPQLRDEVYHTETRDFREALEKDEEVLKPLMKRLDTLRAEHSASR